MVLPDDSERPAGASFILQWFGSIFAEDEYARAATRRVLMEVSRFGAGWCLWPYCTDWDGLWRWFGLKSSGAQL